MSDTKKLILIIIVIFGLILCLCSIGIISIYQNPKQPRILQPITGIGSSEKQKIPREDNNKNSLSEDIKSSDNSVYNDNIYDDNNEEEDIYTEETSVRPNTTHKDKNFIKFSTGENFIELRYYYTNAVVGDCAVFPAAFVPEPSSYPEVKMSEIYANASKQEEVEDRIREVCLAMYGNVKYHQARLYFSKDDDIVYIEGYRWNNPDELSEWKYDNGELRETNF